MKGDSILSQACTGRGGGGGPICICELFPPSSAPPPGFIPFREIFILLPGGSAATVYTVADS